MQAVRADQSHPISLHFIDWKSHCLSFWYHRIRLSHAWASESDEDEIYYTQWEPYGVWTDCDNDGTDCGSFESRPTHKISEFPSPISWKPFSLLENSKRRTGTLGDRIECRNWPRQMLSYPDRHTDNNWLMEMMVGGRRGINWIKRATCTVTSTNLHPCVLSSQLHDRGLHPGP